MDKNIEWMVVSHGFTATLYTSGLLRLIHSKDINWYKVKRTRTNKSFMRRQLMTIETEEQFGWVIMMLHTRRCMEHIDCPSGIVDVTMVLPLVQVANP